MNRIEVQAFEDPSRPEGGHAVILLAGLRKVPRSPAFRLRLIDGEPGAEGAAGWPDGDQLPVTARLTPEGMALVVGPDVAEHPLLVPGVAVEIELPDADVRGEFLWPNIAPLARPRRKSIVVKGPPPRRERDTGQSPVPMPATGRTGEPMPAATAADQSAPQDMPGESPQPQAALRTASTARREGPVKPSAPLQASSAAMTPTGEPADATGDEPARRAGPRDGARFETFYPHARGKRLRQADEAASDRERGSGSLVPTSPLGLATAILLGVAAVQGAIHLAQHNMGGTAPAAAIAPAPAETAGPAALPAGTLYDTLAVGLASPRGVTAKDTGAVRALELAQASLSGPGGQRDTDEGAFWLKRYLAGALGEERNLRALTHLGSVYAKPTGKAPDYVKARLVWEIAGALGDPVAMCFVGALHENGLDVPRDAKLALQWYERSKRAGGCPDVDDAIQRTRQ